MLQFLANTIEQLDLAAEHIGKGDPNNARFGLMLVDNALELTLHQIAKDAEHEAKSWLYRDTPYPKAGLLSAALGRKFDAKLKFARETRFLPADAADSLAICHHFRNELYHEGLQHQPVLPTLAAFHLRIAGEILSSYRPLGFAYSPSMPLPQRARTYFRDPRHFTNAREEYQSACITLAHALPFNATDFADTLSAHAEQIIEAQDVAIEMIATAGPRQMTRDQAVREALAWHVAFTDEGRAYAKARGGRMSVFDLVCAIKETYPLPLKGDPVPRWKNRAQRLRRERNPHRALKTYREFMSQTADARTILDQAHALVDQYVDEQIERTRGR